MCAFEGQMSIWVSHLVTYCSPKYKKNDLLCAFPFHKNMNVIGVLLVQHVFVES